MHDVYKLVDDDLFVYLHVLGQQLLVENEVVCAVIVLDEAVYGLELLLLGELFARVLLLYLLQIVHVGDAFRAVSLEHVIIVQ